MIEYDTIEENMSGALVRYIIWGLEPGSGLTSVLKNDLGMAARCLDNRSWANLRPLLAWLHRFAPHQCYGSKEKVDSWREQDLSEYTELREGLKVFADNGCITSKRALEV